MWSVYWQLDYRLLHGIQIQSFFSSFIQPLKHQSKQQVLIVLKIGRKHHKSKAFDKEFFSSMKWQKKQNSLEISDKNRKLIKEEKKIFHRYLAFRKKEEFPDQDNKKISQERKLNLFGFPWIYCDMDSFKIILSLRKKIIEMDVGWWFHMLEIRCIHVGWVNVSEVSVNWHNNKDAQFEYAKGSVRNNKQQKVPPWIFFFSSVISCG